MDRKKEDNIYCGLLECPLKAGYIEFEFSAGDTVSELLKAVHEKWGKNYRWTHRSKDERVHQGSFGFGSGWLIACDDNSGAYFVLQDDDQIPIVAPPSGEIIEIPKYEEYSGSLRYPGDVEHGVYNVEVFGYPVRKHIKIAFIRDYDVPLDGDFDIKLIAIAAVTGG